MLLLIREIANLNVILSTWWIIFSVCFYCLQFFPPKKIILHSIKLPCTFKSNKVDTANWTFANTQCDEDDFLAAWSSSRFVFVRIAARQIFRGDNHERCRWLHTPALFKSSWSKKGRATCSDETRRKISGENANAAPIIHIVGRSAREQSVLSRLKMINY